jgi:predicted nucleic acid-binding protein
VLSEYYVTVTRKLTPGLSPEEAWADVSALMAWDPVAIDGALLRVARDVEARYGLSWWDAMIIAAAAEAGCATVYSEDLSDGQMYVGVQVVNPLADAK